MKTAVTSVVVILLSAGIGGAREWKDVSGKHTTEAEFHGVEGNDVVLQKQDGSTVKIPLIRLSKSDQECARELAGVKNQAELAAGVKAVFEKGQAETQAKTLLLEADAASQFADRFRGTRLTLRFPIKDVYPEGKPGFYKLRLGKPDFPVEIRYSYATEFSLPLSKRSVMGINQQSLLVVMGSVKVGYPDHEYSKWGQRVLNFSSQSTNRGLFIYLEGMTNRICNPEDEEATIAPAKPAKIEPQNNEKEGSGTITIDSPAGPVVMGNLPKVVAGDGKPADPKMSYTSEMLADGSLLVTISNTPLGTVKAAIPNKDGAVPGLPTLSGSHGFRVQSKIGNPFVSVEYGNGKVTCVKWDGQTVRSETVERVVPRGKQPAAPRAGSVLGDFGIDPDDAPKD